MIKKLLFLLLPLFIGCKQFETKKLNSQDLLLEEASELDWDEVDQYPAFRECRDFIEEERAKACFSNKVAEYVYAQLAQKQPVVTRSLQDTLLLYLSVSEKGIPSIDSVQIDPLVVENLPKIERWLDQSVESLPQIYPATKRGIPVATTFRMPIVIKTE